MLMDAVLQRSGIEIWSRPISPVYQGQFSYAVAFVNRRTDGTPSDIAVTLQELGLAYRGGYDVEVRDNYCQILCNIFPPPSMQSRQESNYHLAPMQINVHAIA